MTEFDPAFVAAMRARGVDLTGLKPDRPEWSTPQLEEIEPDDPHYKTPEQRAAEHIERYGEAPAHKNGNGKRYQLDEFGAELPGAAADESEAITNGTARGEPADREAEQLAREQNNEPPPPQEQAAPPPTTAAEWLNRDLPKEDPLIGHWMSTTSRILFSADTGLGKTNFGMALAGHLGAGIDYLHWHIPRARRVLFIDGEMSAPLFKSRIADVVRRLGCLPPEVSFPQP